MPKLSTLNYVPQICYIALTSKVLLVASVEPVLKHKVVWSSSVGKPVNRPLNQLLVGYSTTADLHKINMKFCG